MGFLEVRSLRAGYGMTNVLWDLNLEIDEASIFCLLGRNGAGKTTLAHVISGLLRQTAGEILIAGESIGRWTPERRARSGVALVPQGRHVFPELTVDENLAVARFAAGKRHDARTATLINDLFPKLKTLRSRLAGTLSGGEQQMVAMARALAAHPRLLILDEPSLGLAPRLVTEMYGAIRHLKDERALTMLLIEQQVSGALGVADRVGVLDDGRLVADHPTAELGGLGMIVDAYLGERPLMGKLTDSR